MNGASVNQSPPGSPAFRYGLGLRTAHYEQALALTESVEFFELVSENFMVPGGKPLRYLDAFSERFPLVLHGVSLSIGSAEPLSLDYVKKLKTLADRAGARWVSDHLCWTSFRGHNSHDLLPLPLSYEALDLVISKVNHVQDVLQRPLVLENISTYARLAPTQMSEAEFFNALTSATGAKILLDVNNAYVNERNHGWSAAQFLKDLNLGTVQQIHLSGHTDNGDHVVDTHDEAISEQVFRLYAQAIRRFGNIPTSIERDDNIPPLEELIRELNYAKSIAQQAERVALPRRTATRLPAAPQLF